ncbi:signal recognition particle, SRP9/SRP14 subunit [Mycotypha africana]|uniref:signal recognition particle, SRP9/SRP14 subunit n=1 Tax=Mycotypha africana TaxID=64632 RepID=UPI002301F1F7|nr:signal recognition particle, SRP9/SRP14 subunit [Mycotypha africana]KAI8973566.1 signal recognition particle, SRP9/SRP14 subunit [Mycotypha africana]
MKEVDPITFTVELGHLYEKSLTSGTVSVTMKRMTVDRLIKASKVKKEMPKGGQEVVDNKDKKDTIQYPCIVRAVYKKVKISTIVAPADFDRFQNAYSTVIRAYMDTLKKKERAKKVKKPTATPKSTE